MSTSRDTRAQRTVADTAQRFGSRGRWIVLGAFIATAGLRSVSLADDAGNRATKIAFQQASPGASQKPGPAVGAKTTAPPPGTSAKDSPPLPFRPITSVGPQVAPLSGLIPPDSSTAYFSSVPTESAPTVRPWDHVEYSWIGTGVCYHPLYFQEWELERRGNSVGVMQPALSSAQFFGRAVALPGLMVMRPPRQFVCTRDPSGGSIWSASSAVVVPSEPEPAEAPAKPSSAPAP